MTHAILAALLLLLAGLALRGAIPPLRRVAIPASVLGGLLGLALVQALRTAGAPADTVAETAADPGLVDRVASHADAIAGTLRGFPGPLIAVVFAGLLLERRESKPAGAAKRAVLNGFVVWMIVLGQVALGLLAAGAFVLPVRDVPPAFGQLIEAGFAGGHGTATGLGEVFAGPLDFPAGRDLGLFMATFGLVWGVVSGLVLVNVGLRRGWAARGRTTDARAAATGDAPTLAAEAARPIGLARVRSDVADPLAIQAAWVALAFLLGLVMQWTFVQACAAVFRPTFGADSEAFAEAMGYAGNVPLFLFTLIGGWAVRLGLERAGLGRLIDGGSIQRIVGTAMDVLIVAGIASLRIEVLEDFLGPIALLCGLGAAWSIVVLVVLAPRMLPRGHWFELGLINYGMSTATTAQGMMLLRIADPDLETPAAEDYALAAPMSAPFVGGGVITFTLPALLAGFGETAGGATAALVVGGVLALVAAGFGAAAMALRPRVDR